MKTAFFPASSEIYFQSKIATAKFSSPSFVELWSKNANSEYHYRSGTLGDKLLYFNMLNLDITKSNQFNKQIMQKEIKASKNTE